MSGEIINKVEKAGLITLDVNSFILPGKRVGLDIVPWLSDNIVREQSFKGHLDSFDWEEMRDKFVAVFCSKDVIIPPWAYLLIQTKLHGIAKQVFFSDLETMDVLLFEKSLSNVRFDQYANKRVFLKVCGNVHLPICAISLCVARLMPHVKSLFYGEPCSNIPLIKN